MLFSCLLLLLALLDRSSTLKSQWEEWKLKHDNSYDNQTEEAFRRSVWEKNVILVLRHNKEASAGKHNFTLGINHLADMTVQEINERLNGLKVEKWPADRNHTLQKERGSNLPLTVDWREDGLVGPVQDQGLCGSCWAFSASGALEGQMKKRTRVLVPLSPQNLVDCSRREGNHGCRGGYITKAYNYITQNRGVDSEQFYPYLGKEGKCHYSVKGKAGYCAGFQVLPHGDEKSLQVAVATIGPIAAAVNAMLPSFQLYHGGVYSVPYCNPHLINHAVLVVGYGSDDGQDFWLVKNSWGTSWGEGGFIRMARNRNNLCGIASHAVYPTL